MASPIELTPQQRLAISRKAIVRNMTQDERSRQHEQDDEAREDSEDFAEGAAGGGTWQLVKHTMRVWWRHHPAHVAVDLARPMVGRYAEEQPLKLIGIAAAVGAAAIVLKPWKLVSLTGLALATLKSSQVSGMLLSLLSSSGGNSINQKDPT